MRLGRPQFLVGGGLLYGLGALVAIVGGARFSLRAFALGQVAVTAIQLMTHYANDFFDAAADRANHTPTRWSGGSRVLTSGALPDGVAWIAARVLLALALLCVAAVAICGGAGGGAGAVVLAAAFVLAWAYSAPPARLHSRGLGELTTAVVVTGLVPLASFLLQAAETRGLTRLGLALAPLIGLQFGMLLAIEFPDAEGDGAVGKRTLIVRLGAKWGSAMYRIVLVLVYGSIPLLVLAGLPLVVGVGAGFMMPVAAWQFHRLAEGASSDRASWEGVAFRAVAMLVVTAAAELATFAWLAFRS